MTSRRSSSVRVLGEFSLIVAGVLTALAADAWNERRRETLVAEAHLEQLRRDTRENQELLRAAVVDQDLGVQSVNAIRRAWRSDSPVSVDSMQVYLVERRLLQPASVQLVRGTLSALIATADINLIGDQEVRVAVLNYIAQVDRLLADALPYQATLNRAGSDLVVAWQAQSDFSSEGLAVWLVGQDDVATKTALGHIWLAGVNYLAILQALADATDSLAVVLEY